MTPRSFDVVVIGAGPAGLAAARAVAEAGLSAVAVDRMGPGGELMNLGDLVGVAHILPDGQGPDVIAKLAEDAMTAGVELAVDDVQRVTDGPRWLIEALDERFEASALIVASGRTPGTTGLAEEVRYEGQGLSHCAHCDAPLYAGKSVVVAGDDQWAVEEAIHLADHASSVTLVSTEELAVTPDRLAELMGLPNVTQITGRISALGGTGMLESVTVEVNGASRTLAAHGLFLQTGREPARGFVETVPVRAEGLYWAGDVRPDATRTVAEAIADGLRAGHNAAAWVKARQSA
ncbi:MAG: NAD(P)/FAD-dependent oxidoreductase [Hyphomicrobiaceae bacterium]|nr:NAD(P)/FAD-dependent oxidoreductase [Hyphomicrobiaceae bacterium]